jgi:hypothetical protein
MLSDRVDWKWSTVRRKVIHLFVVRDPNGSAERYFQAITASILD